MSYGWIPTSIALPDSTNSDKLLIHTVRGDIVTAYYGGETWTGDAIGEHYHNDEVTHWTSLPDPPMMYNYDVLFESPILDGEDLNETP